MDKNTDEIVETLGVILAKMATKEDVESLRAELRVEMQEGFAGLRAEMREGFADIRTEIKSIRERLDALDSAVKNISGYAKEIDHLIERVSAIEKHLGLRANIAA
jgi:plasmid replication initiation protein